MLTLDCQAQVSGFRLATLQLPYAQPCPDNSELALKVCHRLTCEEATLGWSLLERLMNPGEAQTKHLLWGHHNQCGPSNNDPSDPE